MEEKKTWKDVVEDQLPMVLFVGLCISGVVAMAIMHKNEAKMMNEAAKATRETLSDAIKRGATILPNSDGSYWIVENRSKS